MIIRKGDLIASGRTDRYLEELDEHAEDSGVDQLGSPAEIIKTFNMYTLDLRRQKQKFAASIFFLTLLISFVGSNVIALSQPLVLTLPITMIARLLGFPTLILLYLPLMQIGVINPESGDTGSLIAFAALGTLFTCLFWTGLTMFIRYPPQNLFQAFKRK